jgi:hypothetical protein
MVRDGASHLLTMRGLNGLLRPHPEEHRVSDASRRMDGTTIGHSFSLPRDHRLRVLAKQHPSSKTEGAGNAGCETHPQLRVRKNKSTQISHHRFAEHSGIPCAIGFNGFLRALPGDRLSCHRRQRNAKHCRSLGISIGCQDHTTSPSALKRASSGARRRPSHPAPTFVTIAKRPSWRAQDARKSARDLPVVTRQTPAAHWHDGQISWGTQIRVK